MKTNLLCVSLVAVLSAAAAFAQGPDTMRVSVPFDFVVGHQTMPAGEYVVNPDVGGSVVALKNGRAAAMIIGPALHSLGDRGARLVFHRYGNTYFLVEAWSNNAYGRQIPETILERELSAHATQRPV